ncbi:adenosine deaminase [Brevibacterium luteolum]|uniref:Adenosine deaminase n=1 Tax=Brevibacterium luteolum TaxID=199591 RepID=A0A849AMV0_9MICO|nr:adenosine deaminase [Brevibacterium luteolum]MBM7530706.1 adenosine deaminase [Brevibacterium luteolum]NNG78093.1 adenosine deaminase [Brevibacterium luteolum]
MVTREDLRALPKAHLHLHFTGSLADETLAELAAEAGIRLPRGIVGSTPTNLSPDQRGWFRFQRLYDAARAVVRGETIMRRVVAEAAAAERAEGSRWLELQIDPTSYGPYVGGITPALEIVLDEAARQSGPDFGMAIIVAASRTRSQFEARTLARLAAQYAGDEAATVVGFGLSNDERRGDTAEFRHAFRIARRAGLASLPHGGELLGPAHIREVIAHLRPHRLGHGVRAVEDPQLLDQIVDAGIGLEVCPGSNVSLGVYATDEQVPLRRLFDSGAQIALGADDPLIFDSRLVDQYAAAAEAGLTRAEIAELARQSFAISLAPERIRQAAISDIDRWEAAG